MRHYLVKLAMLATLALALSVAFAVGRQSQPQSAPAQDQAAQQAPPPPHVDVEPDPASRKLEQTIEDAFSQDPYFADSRVSVQVTDTEIVLSGVVLTATAKDHAKKIATDHAGGRKVTDLIKVNPNIQPGPGL